MTMSYDVGGKLRGKSAEVKSLAQRIAKPVKAFLADPTLYDLVSLVALLGGADIYLHNAPGTQNLGRDFMYAGGAYLAFRAKDLSGNF